MKLSIWNIYYRLSYPDMIPLIKDGSPTIEGIRWIVSRDLNSDTVYIGSESEFFASSEDNTIIVHRNDMILVHNAVPEEVFNDVSSIVDAYQKWDMQLTECSFHSDGLTQMLAESSFFLQNPSFIYAPDGKALAIAPDYPASIHWHWKEILMQKGLTEERLENLQETIDLTNVFRDRFPTIRDSHMGDHQYMHCSLVVNGYMAGHFVIFSMLHPFENGLEYLVAHLVEHMVRYMTDRYTIYSPTSRISEFIQALIYERPYSEKEFQLFQKLLGWDQLQDIYQFYLFEENVDGEPVFLTRTYQKLSSVLKGSVAFIENDLLVLLINRNHFSLSEQRMNHLLDSLANRFHCGISVPFRGIANVHAYYQQAQEELYRCRSMQLSCSRADAHIAEHMQDLFRGNAVNKTYVKRILLQLKEHDTLYQTSYYITLRAWFYSGFHPTTAATMLDIHRNSFNYRMERMREIIDFTEIDELTTSRDLTGLNTFFYSFLYLDSAFE